MFHFVSERILLGNQFRKLLVFLFESLILLALPNLDFHDLGHRHALVGLSNGFIFFNHLRQEGIFESLETAENPNDSAISRFAVSNSLTSQSVGVKLSSHSLRGLKF